MSPGVSLRDAIERGVELKPCEAVAIAQQLIASADIDVQQPRPAGRLSLDVVRIGADGSVECDAGRVPRDVPEIGMLLAEMLPRDGNVRVPAALLYTIAWALSEVEAPPFESLAHLSAALARHEPRDRVAVLREVYARAVPKPPMHVATGVDRRQRTPSVATLRRQLREADEEMFSYLNRAAATPAAPQTAPPGTAAVEPLILCSESAHVVGDGFNVTRWALGGTLALLIAFGAGYTAVAGLRATYVARPATSALPPEPAPAAAPTTDPSPQPSLAAATPAPGAARRSGDPQSPPSRRTPRQ